MSSRKAAAESPYHFPQLMSRSGNILCQLLVLVFTAMVAGCETDLSKAPAIRSVIGKKYRTVQPLGIFSGAGADGLFLYPLQHPLLRPSPDMKQQAVVPPGSILEVTRVMRTASPTFVQNYFIFSVIDQRGTRMSGIDGSFITESVERNEVPRFMTHGKWDLERKPIALEMK